MNDYLVIFSKGKVIIKLKAQFSILNAKLVVSCIVDSFFHLFSRDLAVVEVYRHVVVGQRDVGSSNTVECAESIFNICLAVRALHSVYSECLFHNA